MITTKIFRRFICSTSFPKRCKSLDSVTCKSLFFNESQKLFEKENLRKYHTYEGDGKTVGFILNKKDSEVLLIGSFMKEGFVMANGMEILGPVIIFPHSLLSWNVVTAKDVNQDSLVLFKILEPKIDLLVFGYGNYGDYTPEVRETFTKACKNLGIRHEALPTEHAVGTFNFLAEERRLVAGALIPPAHVDKLRLSRSLSLADQIEDELDEELPAIGDGRPKKLIN